MFAAHRPRGAPRTAARICTAHTSSDRAETFLMNAIKGSGPAGLSSIPRRRNIVVRPLLDLTHGELVGYLQVHGQPWREDESNEDISYLRNYVRHRVMPVVAQRNASVCKTIGAACEILGDEDAFLVPAFGTGVSKLFAQRGSGCAGARCQAPGCGRGGNRAAHRATGDQAHRSGRSSRDATC